MKPIYFFVLLLVMFTWIACGEPTNTACKSDQECKGTRICKGGECVDPSISSNVDASPAEKPGPSEQSNPPEKSNPTEPSNPDKGGSSYEGRCCINGSFYFCRTAEAFDKCSGFKMDECINKCAGDDFACHDDCFQKLIDQTPDPSSCERQAQNDGTCGTGSLSCRENPLARECTYSSQCSSGNCTKGRCYGNEVGQLCTYSSQCASKNCTH